jgi:hypothetical protein
MMGLFETIYSNNLPGIILLYPQNQFRSITKLGTCVDEQLLLRAKHILDYSNMNPIQIVKSFLELPDLLIQLILSPNGI